MEKMIKSWLADPWALKIIIAVIGLIFIRIVIALVVHSLGRYSECQTFFPIAIF